jgi:hypothetical protein
VHTADRRLEEVQHLVHRTPQQKSLGDILRVALPENSRLRDAAALAEVLEVAVVILDEGGPLGSGIVARRGRSEEQAVGDQLVAELRDVEERRVV